MIINNTPLSMAEIKEYIEKNKDIDQNASSFVKKFTKLKPNEAKEMRKKIAELDLMKLKDDQIIKIIDLMPENIEDLNKIFTGIGLDEDESKKILETVKEFK